MKFRENLKKAKRIVFKLGTNVLTRDDGNLAMSRIYSFIESLSDLKNQNKEIIIVTSGAVGLGAKKLGLKEKPELVTLKQACASVGQGQLMSIYEEGFNKFSILTAQVLITGEDFSNRKKYLNLRSTLNTLIEMGVIPIINENDTISTSELESYNLEGIKVCFGDNDKLSAIVMSKLDADLLVIMSDVDGLYDDDPRINKNANVIAMVKEVTPEIEALGFEASKKGRGGMKTKLDAAKVATHSGGYAVIINGKKEKSIEKLFNGENIGTVFLPIENLSGKKRWIAYATNISGGIKINEGAKKALINKNASLLSAGITEIINEFKKGDVVSIIDDNENEFAKGIVNYTSSECIKIKGKHSDEIEEILGHKNYDAVMTRDNIVIL
ncbi:MAG: glutamate 5-kinase [bacterium]